jgi:hypothetical protein
VAGFLYLGTSGEPLRERERPVVSELVQRWRATAA